MQKLVFFVENGKNHALAAIIGNLYMNRFTIDEDAGHEIVKIYEVEEFGQRLTTHLAQIGIGHIICFFFNILLLSLAMI